MNLSAEKFARGYGMSLALTIAVESGEFCKIVSRCKG
jgi:hypothetical protein